MYNDNIPDHILKIFAGLFFLIVGYEIYQGTTQVIFGIQSRSWARVKGKIIEAKVVDSPRVAYGRTLPGFQVNYPKVRYVYQVGYRPYLGDRIQYGLIYNVRKITERYPPNESVAVFYNPRHPQQSVLEPGVAWLGILHTAMVALFFLGAGLLAWFFPFD